MGVARFVLSYGGCGQLPLIPATWGTLGAALTAAAILLLAPSAGANWTLISIGWIAAALVLTITYTPVLERSSGDSAEKDPQLIVMDEVAGYWTTLLGTTNPDLTHLVVAFFVFRLLDILKPWPAKSLERLPGGWGVCLDDIVAGLYGAVILFAVEAL